MYRKIFGSKGQVTFNSESEYYELLGYLAKSDKSTKLVWEDNDEYGAWAKEGRILFYKTPPDTLRAALSHTEGVGNIVSRVNCNEFVRHISDTHDFVLDGQQDVKKIQQSIPKKYQADFDRGLQL